MKDEEKPHPWAPVPGIDDDYSDVDDEPFELVEGVEDPKASFMLDLTVPALWRRRWLGSKTAVRIWTPRSGWHAVASFVSPTAAQEYALFLANKLKGMLNATEAGSKRR